MEKSTKEIAKEIRTEINKIKGVKVSARSDCNSIGIYLMKAPFEALSNEQKDYQLNHYHYIEDRNLTKEAKVVFQMIDEIIKKYHWDESDAMTDYFHCAFYYHYEIGQWDKPFEVVEN